VSRLTDTQLADAVVDGLAIEGRPLTADELKRGLRHPQPRVAGCWCQTCAKAID
jgi:hypothetical protein